MKTKKRWKVSICIPKVKVTLGSADPRETDEIVVAGSRRVAINRALKNWEAGPGKNFRGPALSVDCWKHVND